MFGGQLTIGTVMVIATVIFHAAALVLLARWLTRLGTKAATLSATRSIGLIATAVLAIVAIHTVEAWSWAALYYALGEFERFERALYFSAVTATTLGFGDIILSDRWQLLSTFEAMGGLLLFGTSTAFLLEAMRHLFTQRSTVATDSGGDSDSRPTA